MWAKENLYLNHLLNYASFFFHFLKKYLQQQPAKSKLKRRKWSDRMLRLKSLRNEFMCVFISIVFPCFLLHSWNFSSAIKRILARLESFLSSDLFSLIGEKSKKLLGVEGRLTEILNYINTRKCLWITLYTSLMASGVVNSFLK